MNSSAAGSPGLIVSSIHVLLGYHNVVDASFFSHRKAGTPKRILFADEAGMPADPGATSSYGFYWTEGTRGLGLAHDAIPTLKGGSTIGIPSPPAILLRTGEIVTPHIRDAERLQGFDAGWTAPAEEVGRASMRWKLVGNAVTVDLFEWIGQRLLEPGGIQFALGDAKPIEGKWPPAAFGRGGLRWVAPVSEFPKSVAAPPIAKFLKHQPKPLSLRAASGFYSRISKSSLRTPPNFRERVAAYVDKFECSTSVA